MANKAERVLGFGALVVGVFGTVAAWLVVPEFRRFTGLEPTPSSSPEIATTPIPGSADGRGSRHPSEAFTPPRTPYIEKDVSPWEGALYGTTWRASRSFHLHSEPHSDAPIVAVISEGDEIRDETGQTITTQFGTYRIVRDATLEARSAGMSAVVTVRSGATVYMVNYYGEGRARFWHDGRFFDATQFTLEAISTLTQPIEREWWVFGRTRNGQKGWIKDPFAKGKKAGG